MVMTTSAALTNSSVSGVGNSLDMSTPSALITSTAAGLISAAGALPAERTLTLSPAYRASNPAAIWLRPALWTQTKRTSGTGVSVTRSGALAGADGGTADGARQDTVSKNPSTIVNVLWRRASPGAAGPAAGPVLRDLRAGRPGLGRRGGGPPEGARRPDSPQHGCLPVAGQRSRLHP